MMRLTEFLVIIFCLGQIVVALQSTLVNVTLSPSEVEVGGSFNLSVEFVFDNSMFVSLKCGYGTVSSHTSFSEYNRFERKLKLVTSGFPAAYTGRVTLTGAMMMTISKVPFNDEGTNYLCEYQYYDSASSTTKTVYSNNQILTTVYALPVFGSNSMESNSNIIEGRNSFLTCIVTSRPASSIMWSYDSASITATQITFTVTYAYYISVYGTLQISNVDMAMNGKQVTCMGVPVYGQNITSTTTLNVLHLPKNVSLTVSPENPKQGEMITLACTATAKPAVSNYHFYLNDTSLGSSANGRVMFNATICKQFTGIYKCSASNTIGVSAYATKNVFVSGSVKISPKLSPMTVNEKSNLKMQCSVTGCPEASIKWTKTEDYAFASYGSTLEFSSVMRYNAGTYTCFADNGVTNDTSQAVLTVNFPPTIIATMTPNTVNESNNAALRCTVTTAKPPATVTAFDPPNNVIALVNGTAQVSNVTRWSSGRYSCRADNGVGLPVTKYAELTVHYTPKDVSIRVAPDNPKQGEMITITCNATAKPAVNNYNFYRNDTFLGSSGNGKVMVNATDCKQFTGIYKCSATNTMGVSANATKSVAVKAPVKISPKLSSMTVNETSNVTMQCFATGCPAASVKWTKKEDNSFASHGSTLELTSVTKSTAGTYTCAADNGYTSDTSEAVLTVNYKPISTAFTTATLKPVQNSQVMINCTADAVPSAMYKFFQVTNGSETEVSSTSAEKSGVLTISSINFVPGSYVTYKCVPYNMLGQGPSKSVTLNIQDICMPDTNATHTVDLVEVAANSSTSLKLVWNSMLHSNNTPSTPISGYKIFFSISPYCSWQNSSQVQQYQRLVINTAEAQGLSGFLTYVIPGLRKWTCYKVKICAVTKYCEFYGLNSTSKFARTLEDVPTAPPRNFTAVANDSSSLRLDWHEPDNLRIHGILRSYTVRYQQVNCITGKAISDSSGWNRITVAANTSSTIVSNLLFWSCYDVAIAAVTIDEGPFANQRKVRTNEHAPTGAPRNLTAVAYSSTNIKVDWREPDPLKTHGIITRYFIRYEKVNCADGTVMKDGIGFVTVIVPGSSRDLLLYLSFWSCYDVRVAAYTIDLGPFVNQRNVRTKEHAPTAPPRNFTALNTSSTSLFLSWTKPTESQINGIVRYYLLTYREVHCDTSYVVKSANVKNKTVTGNVYNASLTQLSYWTCYDITLSAVTVGVGPYAQITNVRTSIPSQNPYVIATISTSIVEVGNSFNITVDFDSEVLHTLTSLKCGYETISNITVFAEYNRSDSSFKLVTPRISSKFAGRVSIPSSKTITISNAQFEDEGTNFTCELKYWNIMAGRSKTVYSNNINITAVYASPFFGTNSWTTNSDVVDGVNTTLKCNVTSRPASRIMYGLHFNSSTGFSFMARSTTINLKASVVNNGYYTSTIGTVTLFNPTLKINGLRLTCIGVPVYGERITSITYVRILYAPEITVMNETLKTCQTKTVTIGCSASGVPVPVLRIYHNQMLIATGNKTISYNLKMKDESDFGTYYCNASNLVGNSRKSMIVKRTDLPGIPEDFQLLSGINSFEVKWKSPVCQGIIGIAYYRINYTKSGDEQWKILNKTCCNFTVHSLPSNTTYLVQITAFDRKGLQGPTSQPEMVVTDLDECATNSHMCHSNATCTNTNGWYICTCNGGFRGDGFNCTAKRPIEFERSPANVITTTNTSVTISCSFYSRESVLFQWVKDGYEIKSQSFVSSGSVFTVLRLKILRPDQQGFYWCRLKQNNRLVAESQKGLVQALDASSSKLSLALSRKFSQAMRNQSSADHISLKSSIKTKIDNFMHQKGMQEKAVLLLKNMHGNLNQTLLDVMVHFGPVSNASKVEICSRMNEITTADLTSKDLEIILVERSSYDCCYSEVTGETKIKGMINWPVTTISDESSIKCPYAKKGNVFAVRKCIGNRFTRPPIWQVPDASKCPYKSETTKELDNLSKEKVNASTVNKVVKKLEKVTESPKNITNHLDITFAVDTITNIVSFDNSSKNAFDSIIGVTDNLMSVNESIVVNSQKKSNSSEKLIKAVKSLAENIPVKENTNMTISTKNLAVGVAVLPASKSTQGFYIRGEKDLNRTNLKMKRMGENQARTEIVDIYLPAGLLSKAKVGGTQGIRITTFLYDNHKLFYSESTSGLDATKRFNSKIFDVSVKGRKILNLTETERIRSEFASINGSQQQEMLQCVYWEDSKRDWSTEGCRYDGQVERSANVYKCSCNHLTNFALLVDLNQSKKRVVKKGVRLFLKFFTLIGCGLSLAGLVITLITLVAFRRLRSKDPQRILMALSFSLIASLVSFLVGTKMKGLNCKITSISIHFWVLSSFFWMAAQAYNLYLNCVKVVGVHKVHIIKMMMAFAWGIPMIIVGVTAGVTKLRSYARENENGDWICMVHGIPFWATYLGPILAIIVANIILMFLAFRGVFQSAQKTNRKAMSRKRKAKMIISCSFLMGLTWIFGVFAVEDLTDVFQIIFTVFNSLQGLFIFIFYCVMNKSVQKEWRKLFYGNANEYSSSGRSTKTRSTTLRKGSTKEDDSFAGPSRIKSIFSWKKGVYKLDEAVVSESGMPKEDPMEIQPKRQADQDSGKRKIMSFVGPASQSDEEVELERLDNK